MVQVQSSEKFQARKKLTRAEVDAGLSAFARGYAGKKDQDDLQDDLQDALEATLASNAYARGAFKNQDHVDAFVKGRIKIAKKARTGPRPRKGRHVGSVPLKDDGVPFDIAAVRSQSESMRGIYSSHLTRARRDTLRASRPSRNHHDKERGVAWGWFGREWSDPKDWPKPTRDGQMPAGWWTHISGGKSRWIEMSDSGWIDLTTSISWSLQAEELESVLGEIADLEEDMEVQGAVLDSVLARPASKTEPPVTVSTSSRMRELKAMFDRGTAGQRELDELGSRGTALEDLPFDLAKALLSGLAKMELLRRSKLAQFEALRGCTWCCGNGAAHDPACIGLRYGVRSRGWTTGQIMPDPPSRLGTKHL